MNIYSESIWNTEGDKFLSIPPRIQKPVDVEASVYIHYRFLMKIKPLKSVAIDFFRDIEAEQTRLIIGVIA